MITLAKQTMDRGDQVAGHSEEDGRVTRRFLAPPMHGVHECLRRWMEDAGMEVRVDAVGNIVGRRSVAASPAGDQQAMLVLMIGSHLDTVPNAGKYDGILGVLEGTIVIDGQKLGSDDFAWFPPDDGCRLHDNGDGKVFLDLVITGIRLPKATRFGWPRIALNGSTRWESNPRAISTTKIFIVTR